MKLLANKKKARVIVSIHYAYISIIHGYIVLVFKSELFRRNVPSIRLKTRQCVWNHSELLILCFIC